MGVTVIFLRDGQGKIFYSYSLEIPCLSENMVIEANIEGDKVHGKFVVTRITQYLGTLADWKGTPRTNPLILDVVNYVPETLHERLEASVDRVSH